MVIFRKRKINNAKKIKKKLVGQIRIFMEKFILEDDFGNLFMEMRINGRENCYRCVSVNKYSFVVKAIISCAFLGHVG